MNAIVSIWLESVVPGVLVLAILMAALPWIPRNSRWRMLPIGLVLVMIARYLAWRILDTLPPSSDPVDFSAGLIFLGIELAAVTGSIISYVTLTRTRCRSHEADANIGWLANRKKQPLVDVFICTYNEDRELLERTMLGALGIAYANFRVWVLDDGNRPWLGELAETLGCRYLTRPDNTHAKAGNINHALRHVAALDEPPDFVSILDADFVPTQKFLRRTMSLFREDDVGIVQTPQHFINPDPIQANLQVAEVWPDEQRYFFEVLMPSKDAWGTVFCCGTSSVIRMSALCKAGGFPTESVTEDYMLTLRLKRFGFRTVYLNEKLTFGLAPEGLKEYITQRSRWCLGFAQIMRSADGPFAWRNGMRFIDRLGLVESMLYWSAAYIFRFAAIIVPILFLLFNIQAVDVSPSEAVANFLPYYLSQIIVMSWLSDRRVLPILTDVSQLLSAREIVTAFFIGITRPQNRKFKVTTKGGDRSQTVIQWRMLSIFGALLVMTILGIIVAFGRAQSVSGSSAIALFWSWYNIVLLIVAVAICVERPRLRKSERMTAAMPVRISANGRSFQLQSADISLGGVRLIGECPFARGSQVEIEIDNIRLNGRIVRVAEQDFAIEVETGMSARVTMLRQVYSGRWNASVGQIRSTLVMRKLIFRLLG